jgi:hypothetical protein
MMKADQIGRGDHLREWMNRVGSKLRTQGGMPRPDPRTQSACTVDVLAPAGYHQAQQIADSLGVDFEETFSNEDEWDRFRREVNALRTLVERELQRRFELPEGLFLFLGYDPEGNFGLFLRSTDTGMAVPPRCSPPPREENPSY